MVHPVVFGVFAQHHVIEAEATHFLERGLEAAEDFQGSIGLDEVISVENDQTIEILDWHYRLIEVAIVSSVGCAALRLQGIAVHIVTTVLIDGGYHVCANTLSDEPGFQAKGCVSAHGPTVGAHGYS
ncbi:hypothetical protein D9M69_538820 [compost metagenome]